MRRLRASLVVVGLLGVFPAAASAQPPAVAAPPTHPRAERLGAIASLGLGTQYAGVGVQVLVFQPLPLFPFGQPVALVAGAAFGTPGTLDGRLHLTGQDQRLKGFSFTAGASAGRVHRLCLAAGWSALNGRGVPIEGLVVDSVTAYGPFIEAGYEMLATNGIFLRVLPLGVSYLPAARWRPRASVDLAFSLGVGWKPW